MGFLITWHKLDYFYLFLVNILIMRQSLTKQLHALFMWLRNATPAYVNKSIVITVKGQRSVLPLVLFLCHPDQKNFLFLQKVGIFS